MRRRKSDRQGRSKLIAHNRIGLGRYSIRVVAGPKFEDRNDEAMNDLLEIAKVSPSVIQQPAVMAKLYPVDRGGGNPQIDAIADSLVPDPSKMTPEMMAGQLAQAQKMSQAQGVLIQKLQQAIQGKLPQVEADKWKAALDSYTKITVAKITASKDADTDQANREASLLESILQMAHETASDAADREHQSGLAMQRRKRPPRSNPRNRAARHNRSFHAGKKSRFRRQRTVTSTLPSGRRTGHSARPNGIAAKAVEAKSAETKPPQGEAKRTEGEDAAATAEHSPRTEQASHRGSGRARAPTRTRGLTKSGKPEPEVSDRFRRPVSLSAR